MVKVMIKTFYVVTCPNPYMAVMKQYIGSNCFEAIGTEYPQYAVIIIRRSYYNRLMIIALVHSYKEYLVTILNCYSKYYFSNEGIL